MRAAVTSAMMATDLADYLVRKGATFRESHAAVGKLVREAEEQGIELTALPAARFAAAHPKFGRDAQRELIAEETLRYRALPGGTALSSVRSQLADARKSL
jgi:argininosuccinate lyase